MGLQSIRIILVEPQGPLNIGSVARVMKNMGLKKLLLVNPRCDFLGEEARHMAVHGVEILETAQQVETIPEALSGCQRAIATTSRVRGLPTMPESPKVVLPWLLEDTSSSALIFGPEDRGLSNIELNYAQRFLCIPSADAYPSLNLAQAVAICCYELYQTASEMPQTTTSEVERASLDMLEGYYQHLEAVLLKIGYIYPHTASSRLQKFRYLFNRAAPTTEEVTMLRGILRQIEWAIKNQPQSGENRETKPF